MWIVWPVTVRANRLCLVWGLVTLFVLVPAVAGVVQLPWEGTREAWTRARDRVAAASASQLETSIREGESDARLYVRPFEMDLAGCVALWELESDTAARDAAVRAIGIALAPWDSAADQSLVAAVTTKGSIEPTNLRLRDAAYHFALRYRLSGDPSDARRSAAIIDAFAAAVPEWPVWSPYYEVPDRKQPLPQTDSATFRGDYAAGLWGGWIYQDLVNAIPLMQAFRWIEASGQQDAAARDRAIKLFRLFLDVQRRRGGAEFTNMDAFKIRGLVSWGMLMQDATVVHEGIWHLRSIFRTGFFPDGWWHEGSPIYHSDLVMGLRSIATGLLAGYSDPPGFVGSDSDPRIDRFDPAAFLGERPDAALRLIESQTLPTGAFLAVHDTDWRTKSPVAPPARRASVLHGCFGQASLSCGQPGTETVATLHWSGSGVHAHLDSLNLNLWAKGTEVISETQYQPVPGSDSTREWHTSTAGHVTVVVDERSQSNTGPLGRRFRERSDLDAISGIPDWPWRFRGENANDFGELRFYDANFTNVQVVEAAAPSSYSSVIAVKEYARTLALVRIDERDAYLVDIFRVAGGGIHDYMLHANLQDPYTVRTSVPMTDREGVAHGSLALLKSGRTDDLWLARFLCRPGLNLNTFMCPSPGTEVFLARGPAMRRPGDAPFLFARRRGESDCFVAVHHVIEDGPSRIRAIEQLPSNDPSTVALRITLDKRVDTVIASPTRDSEVAIEGGFRTRARFVHVAQSQDPLQQWMFMVDGDRLIAEGCELAGDTSVSGRVVATERRDAGSAANALLTEAPVQSAGGLSGQAVVVDLAGLATWSFEASGVEPSGAGSRISITHDPGFIVDGTVVKQVAFPNWGAAGNATFRVPGSALVTWDLSGQRNFRTSGNCAIKPSK